MYCYASFVRLFFDSAYYLLTLFRYTPPPPQCPGQGGPFEEDEMLNGVQITRVWSIFLQYPVLAYLDSVKKQVLIGQIVRLINVGGQPTVTTDNICIGRVYHYDVSLYTES